MTEAPESPREVTGDPGVLPMMLRAALPVLPGVGLLPGIRRSGSTLPPLALTRYDVPIDRAHVAAYSAVCGFGTKATVPLTYPHVLAFGLHLAILTDRAFPFPAIGTVHVQNSITAHRAISDREVLQLTARPQDLRNHAKGQAFDIATQVHSAGELVWEETSTFLRRGRPHPEAAQPDQRLEPVAPSGIEWRLGGDLGRRYAHVSGDHNPIHLSRLSAKAFGFPRQIAHGMWSEARCLAALDGRLPDAVTVDVAFKRPVLLPGTVAFGSRRLGRGDGQGDWSFALSSPKGGAPHLLGRTTGRT
jgi:acyl dehydratase